MQPLLHIDFETRSTVDLKKTTTDVYAKDPTTDVWCMAYAFDDEPVELVTPVTANSPEHILDGAPGMYDVMNHVQDGGLVYGHNITFEWHIWNKIMAPQYGWPELKIEQCRCTMAMAYAMSLPGSLENAAAATGLEIQKDMNGHRLMLQMAKPRKIEADGTVVWWDDPEKLQRLYTYCKQDVETERALHARLRELSGAEQKLWFIDQRINERGVYIDAEAVQKAQRLAEINGQKLNTEIDQVSDGWIGSYTYVNQITDFLRMNGVETKGVAKADVTALLKQDIPDSVRRVLEIRQAGAKTSTAKFDTMLNSASEDGRVRGLFQYHGANTGRWAGRKVQLHNLPRPTLEQYEIEDILDNHLDEYDAITVLYGDVLDVLASCLRGVITAGPGNELSVLDYSNIEGRDLAWLAGEEWKLDAFRAFDRKEGPDLYKVTAGSILGIPPEDVSKLMRQNLGKVSELALGYEGGVGAFQQFARAFSIDMAEHFNTIKESLPGYFEKAKDNYKQRGKGSGVSTKAWVASEMVKLAWRDRHPATTTFWKNLNQAAIAAVNSPTSIQKVGRVKFIKKGSFLWCQLPSKRLLCYPYPRIEMETTPWGSEVEKLWYKGVNQKTRKWTDLETYGGKLAENITQGVARDPLSESIVRLEDRDYPVVMHVHDEIVCEDKIGKIKLSDMATLMTELPVWAKGLPVAVEGWQGKRYRK
jgi:DNA polymerase